MPEAVPERQLRTGSLCCCGAEAASLCIPRSLQKMRIIALSQSCGSTVRTPPPAPQTCPLISVGPESRKGCHHHFQGSV